MENPLPRQAKVFAMNLGGDEDLSRRLKKNLLKFIGVGKVKIDIENNLVCVEGEIDATNLMNYFAEQDIHAVFVSGGKQREKHNHERNGGIRGNNSAAPEKGKLHKNHFCEDGCRGTMKKQVEQKVAHKPEPYVPPPVDPRVCRDFYCKTHPRGRLITDKVTPEYYSLFGMGQQMPIYGTNGPFGGGVPYQYPGWPREDSPMPMFGYGQQAMNLPFHQFGYGYHQ